MHISSLCISLQSRYFHPDSEALELDVKFWELRDSIVQCELLILRQLNFQVSFDHPHRVMHVTGTFFSTRFFCIRNISVFQRKVKLYKFEKT